MFSYMFIYLKKYTHMPTPLGGGHGFEFLFVFEQ